MVNFLGQNFRVAKANFERAQKLWKITVNLKNSVLIKWEAFHFQPEFQTILNYL